MLFRSDPVTVAGLRFPNRIGLAAGLDKNGRAIDGFGAMGFGFVEVGTVTPKAQPGNPKPRMFRLPSAEALINRMGFNNAGVDKLLENVRAAEFPKKGGILTYMIPADAPPSLDGHKENTFATLHATAPFYSTLIAINPSNPSSSTDRKSTRLNSSH